MPNLTKRDLVIRISNETGIVQRRVLHVIDSTLSHLIENLASGKTVEFRNFGIFEVKLRKARVGRNPHFPQHSVPIPSRPQVKFTAGKILKTRVMQLSNTAPVSATNGSSPEQDNPQFQQAS